MLAVLVKSLSVNPRHALKTPGMDPGMMLHSCNFREAARGVWRGVVSQSSAIGESEVQWEIASRDKVERIEENP